MHTTDLRSTTLAVSMIVARKCSLSDASYIWGSKSQGRLLHRHAAGHSYTWMSCMYFTLECCLVRGATIWPCKSYRKRKYTGPKPSQMVLQVRGYVCGRWKHNRTRLLTLNMLRFSICTAARTYITGENERTPGSKKASQVLSDQIRASIAREQKMRSDTLSFEAVPFSLTTGNQS